MFSYDTYNNVLLLYIVIKEGACGETLVSRKVSRKKLNSFSSNYYKTIKQLN